MKGGYNANKNFKNATEVVINFWRYDATKLCERNLKIIDERKMEFADSGMRTEYRETSSQITLMRKTAL